ncbi:MAG: hypothetical protein ACKOOL_13240 [Novosphingobium sp.]
MADTARSLALFPAALIACTALAACGEKSGGSGNATASGSAAAAAPASQLFPDDFKGVCSGASVAAATAFDPAAAAHKALFFSTYKDDLTDSSSSLPPDWTVQWSQQGDALKAIDLVVCARRTAATEVKVCDGYKDDDKPTQNKVRWHTATYELTVREAQSGKQIAQSTAEATSTSCPMFMSFDGDNETVDGYASLSDTVVADFLRPHIKK